MKIWIISLLASLILNSMTQAASEHIVWGRADNYFGHTNKPGALQFKNNSKNQYQLKALDSDHNRNPQHIRYQIYYKNIPIWGHELILHKNETSEDSVTGINVSGLDTELIETNGQFTSV